METNQEGQASLSLIENIDIHKAKSTMYKIQSFQSIVQKNLRQNHDYGIIPGTPKPTLLKPGAEKILMLMGITSRYEVIERVQDYREGFFAFSVKCVLEKGGITITEGLGHCNSKERKYINQDSYTIANTCLKMAKKRSQIDATLTVASLSEIFSQDLDEIDLDGVDIKTSSNKAPTDNGAIITEGQARRLFAMAKGDADLIKGIIEKYGYKSTKEIKKIDYDKIDAEVTAAV